MTGLLFLVLSVFGGGRNGVVEDYGLVVDAPSFEPMPGIIDPLPLPDVPDEVYTGPTKDDPGIGGSYPGMPLEGVVHEIHPGTPVDVNLRLKPVETFPTLEESITPPPRLEPSTRWTPDIIRTTIRARKDTTLAESIIAPSASLGTRDRVQPPELPTAYVPSPYKESAIPVTLEPVETYPTLESSITLPPGVQPSTRRYYIR